MVKQLPGMCEALGFDPQHDLPPLKKKKSLEGKSNFIKSDKVLVGH